MFPLFTVLFVVVFLVVFVSILTSGWRMSRMVNKVFSLAEREMDRKLNDPSAEDAAAAQPLLSRCAHCGSNVSAGAPCPNCGAATSGSSVQN